MKSLALGWCSLRAVLRRGFCGGVGRRWGVGGALGLVCVVGRAEPVVSNVTSSQIAGTREVAITYTLADATALDGRFNVTVQASRDNGATWAPVTQVTGAVSDVAPGSGKQITWKAGVEWPGLLLPQAKVRLIADTSMALIPGGTFTMGSVVASIVGADKSDGITDAPAHAVTLSAFYLGKTETTYADWVAVRTWARDAARGAGVYDFGATVGAGKGDTHPVQTVSWYDVVKWCNAKSEREGLTPVYYTNDAQTLVYRTGDVAVTAAQVKWGANGYRLPTEAEWEYAARGGSSGQRFSWGDTITHVQANYYSTTSRAYDVSTTRGYHPTYATGGEPYTSPVGVFAANGYGLSDMVGNVWEWTWDVYGSYGSGAVTDPRGATSGTFRVYRGGGWYWVAIDARSAYRNYGNPDIRSNYRDIGFRTARSLEAPGVPTSVSAVGGNGQAVVSFTAPSNVGWSVITGYTVRATSPSGEVISATGASSPITVTGLLNGGLYTFTVAATNSGGTGAASSASVAVRLADPGMALIPGGTYTMGSVVGVGQITDDGIDNATPHAVTLSAFYLGKTETTYADWVALRTWARDAARGTGVYDFGATVGAGKGDTHPVQNVSWYDVVKWCNAKSERAGLTPVYYTNDAQTLVYRTGNVAVTTAQVKWGANGYRLPTEAEWEYAARGGVSGQRFPWGDTLTHAQANYWSSASHAYDVSATRGNHPTYGGTSPVGVFAANGYGLSDMAGNVFEWTWDWYGSYGSGAVTDPRGAASGTFRVGRGGGWYLEANYARSAYRFINAPDYRYNDVGFRLARSSVP